MLLGRLVFLVSGTQLPVEENSLPLHLIGREPPETEAAVAQFVAARPDLWQQYGGWLATFHPTAYEGVLHMAKIKKEKFGISLEPLVETMGLEWVIQQLGVERVLQGLGPKRVIEQLGTERVIEQLDAEAICAALTPRQRQQLKRLLEK